LITDGRLSGTIRGVAVAHISPEGGVAGPLAVVRDGDKISIDIDARTIDLDVPDDELAERIAGYTPADPGLLDGVLRQYRHLAGPAERGALIQVGNREECDD
jgi:dihydroxy-acid dehydratase